MSLTTQINYFNSYFKQSYILQLRKQLMKMNIQHWEESKCRICLEGNAELDWSGLLCDYGQLTYKDCYYKYTQLEKYDDGNFTTVICRNCSNGLEYIHTFISKAIENHVILQERLPFKTVTKDEVKQAIPNFEIIIEKTEAMSEIDSTFMNKDSSEELLIPRTENNSCSTSERCTTPLMQIEKPKKRKSIRRANKSKFAKLNQLISDESPLDDKMDSNVCKAEAKDRLNNTKEMSMGENVEIESGHFIDIRSFDSSADTLLKQQCSKSSFAGIKNSSTRRKHKYKLLPKTIFKGKVNESCNPKSPESYIKMEHKRGKRESVDCDINEECVTKSLLSSTSILAGRAKKKKILICQYCSLEVNGTTQLKLHEATHSENRKRTETCPKCGIKMYTKSTLSEHMKIHDENRQKNHKCEFCEKAFFNKGTLNVHRRVHLGLMVKCQMCPKEFFRQTELDKHMNSHSATLLNAEPKKRSRYMVRCKYCNKSMLSTSFKAHTAAHLNEPLMKCSICSKEFFRRDSCTDHLKLTHKKKAEEYKNFIILYKTNRLSHLYLEQTAELLPNED